jgi:F420-non-reducing hydrogenase iron-sulfur subunit
MADKKYLQISIFHCINVFGEGEALTATPQENTMILKFHKLPCSSMVKDIFLLRAFEAGADGVMVLVCPEGACRYVEGNMRAKKRAQWVRTLLDDIGLDGRRLSFFNLAAGDVKGFNEALLKVGEQIRALGPNPAG